MSLSEKFGSFSSNVITEWNEDDHRSMTLVREFWFEDPNGKTWHVPAGAKVDGASIPWWLWTVVGSPFVGKYRNASVVHDHFCRLESEPWEDVHKLFYFACRAGGVSRYKALMMYWAVYWRGPRWPEDDRLGARLVKMFYRDFFPRHTGLN